MNYRFVDHSSREPVLGEDGMDALQMSALSCQMKARHAVVAPKNHVGSEVQQVLDDVGVTFGTGQHQRGTIVFVQRIQFGTNLEIIIFCFDIKRFSRSYPCFLVQLGGQFIAGQFITGLFIPTPC